MSDIALIDPDVMRVPPLDSNTRFAFSDEQHSVTVTQWVGVEQCLPETATHFFIEGLSAQHLTHFHARMETRP